MYDYILRSVDHPNQAYVGISEDFKKRLQAHIEFAIVIELRVHAARTWPIHTHIKIKALATGKGALVSSPPH